MIMVNMHSNGTSPDGHRKVVYMLAMDMAESYNIPKNRAIDIVANHMDELSDWINKVYSTSTQPFVLGGLANGIQFNDESFFTMMLLKSPKLLSFS